MGEDTTSKSFGSKNKADETTGLGPTASATTSEKSSAVPPSSSASAPANDPRSPPWESVHRLEHAELEALTDTGDLPAMVQQFKRASEKAAYFKTIDPRARIEGLIFYPATPGDGMTPHQSAAYSVSMLTPAIESFGQFRLQAERNLKDGRESWNKDKESQANSRVRSAFLEWEKKHSNRLKLRCVDDLGRVREFIKGTRGETNHKKNAERLRKLLRDGCLRQ